MDVSVITQLQFQQFFVEYVEVPQLQFIDRVVVFQLLHRDRAHSANCAEDRRFARCSSWIGWDTPVVVQRQARMVQTVQSGGAEGAVPAVLDAFGGSEGFFIGFSTFFALLLVVPELSASSSEPSMVKSSSSSRARGWR